MTRRVRTGVDVDTDRFVIDLRSVAFEIEDGLAYLDAIEVESGVETEHSESVSLTIEIMPTEDSILSGGYEIPYET